MVQDVGINMVGLQVMRVRYRYGREDDINSKTVMHKKLEEAGIYMKW